MLKTWIFRGALKAFEYKGFPPAYDGYRVIRILGENPPNGELAGSQGYPIGVQVRVKLGLEEFYRETETAHLLDNYKDTEGRIVAWVIYERSRQ